MNILDFTIEDWKEYVLEKGKPSFCAKQIYKWAYSGIKSIDEMTNISKDMREQLKKDFYIFLPSIKKKLVSKIDGTVKYLFELYDGSCIEGVIMRYHHGITMCVSSQVGCRMGCKFCASTLHGLERNLTAGEIAGQIICAQNDIGERISNIVMMGSGEPFDNTENVFDFIKNAVNPEGLCIGARHITVSTCGLIEGIKNLQELSLPINLSISLHAPNDKIRKQTMPIANKIDIKTLVGAAKEYYNVTGRRVTFEYALIDGVNDSKETAEELSALIAGKEDVHVNLIPLNDVAERNLKKSKNDSISAFVKVLEKNKIKATVRREMGADINAACGQLRNEFGLRR